MAVPATDPAVLPPARIRYLSGSGPVAGGDQRNEIEPAVAGPAASPAGRNTGGWFHGAQTARPAARAAATTTAATVTTGPRRRRRGAAEPKSCAAAGPGGTAAARAAAGSGAGTCGSVIVFPL